MSATTRFSLTVTTTTVEQFDFDDKMALINHLTFIPEPAPSVPEPAPSVPEPTPSVPELTVDNLIADLNDDRFTLRKLDTLAGKYNTSPDAVLQALNAASVDYVIRIKRNSGERLVGLSRRN